VGITASFTNVLIGFRVQFSALIEGRTAASSWDFEDGAAVTNQPYTSHAWTALGDYAVVLRAYNETQPGGISATVTVHVVTQLVHYVAAQSANPVAPYTSWATAATNIQDAVDAAVEPGASVLVTNGLYASGGRAVYGTTNRVAIDKSWITLRSVNGPEFTVIDGSGSARCLYLTNGAAVSGFTLTNGFARSGGGLWCESTNATIFNCVLASNSASFFGGGAYEGTLNNCTLTGNSAGSGGGAYVGTLNDCFLSGNFATSGAGAYSCTLNNCTLSGNSSYSGGGASASTLNNCIAYFNTARQWANYDPYSVLNYCCTTPQPTNGLGNISLDPQLASASHLSAGSPCRGAGNTAYTTGTDIDGEAWADPPSIGCDEYHAGAVTGPLSVGITASFTNVLIGFRVQFSALIEGRTAASSWDFEDGAAVTNQPYTSHAWTALGDYAVVLRAYNETQPGGISATVTVHVVTQLVHYVAAQSANPVAPYTSWATAATNIQDAVDAAVEPGASVLVTNGLYASGGRAVYGTTNRVAIDKSWITLRSVNGPEFTVIDGSGSARCLYLTNGAAVSGFTLTNGFARSGGGLLCESTNAVVSNCVLAGNSAGDGGGAYSATLNNCALLSNSCSYNGGGANSCTLNDCTITGNAATDYGGGAYYSTLNRCTFRSNSAGTGGGAHFSTLNNCALTGNSAADGGGAYSCTLNNCTLTGNKATYLGGGAYGGTLNNCIVYFNTALQGGNCDSSSILNYCCTTPRPTSGAGNISLDPQLASSSHLSATSPCRGAGNSHYATGADIDGEPWASPPAIGCDGYYAGARTGSLSVGISAAFTNVAVGFTVEFVALIQGQTTASTWDFGDSTQATNQPYISHVWTTPGDYPVDLRAFNETQPDGISATVTVHVVVQPVHYVAVGSTNPVPPYTTWATAASTIQDAVDAATVLGALVLVTNGNYAFGGRAVSGAINRVVIDKLLTVRSVNGPQFTVIDGGASVRCVYLTNNAALSGFTLTNGGSSGGGASGGTLNNCTLIGNSGGGANGCALNNCTLTANTESGATYCTLSNCTLTANAAYLGGGAYFSTLNNCFLTGNSAILYGGGAVSCTLNNCTLTGNSAGQGGGAAGGTLNNCALSGNSAYSGGGVSDYVDYDDCNDYSTTFPVALNNCTLSGNSARDSGGGASQATMNNCIVYFNTAAQGANYDDNSSLNYCCTTPQPTSGVGNISLDPQLASASHLSATSPCQGAGNANYAVGTDIDGEPWANPPSIGCDEYHAGAVTGPLSAAIAATFTNVATGFTVGLTGLIEGRPSASTWDFGDGTGTTNQPYTSHVWASPGDYAVVLRAYNETQPGGITATVIVHVVTQPVHYVAANSSSPSPPYTSWATAASTIQDAVDAAVVPGAVVLVTNGIYAKGGRVGSTNRVVIDKLLTVRSVNGPQLTLIDGSRLVRCAYLTNGAALSGFTLTNGASSLGGGVWCWSQAETVDNCVLVRNFSDYGGGAYGGMLSNCTLNANSASYGGGAYTATLSQCALSGNFCSYNGGGAFGGTLNACTLTHNLAGDGGAAYSATLNNCALLSNSCSYSGGGANSCTLNNCVLTGNSAGDGGAASQSTLNNCALTGNSAADGGGAYSCTVNNCTLTSNSATSSGGGASGGTLNNCIVYFNNAAQGANYDSHSALNYSCSTPQPTYGFGNITNAPLFVDAAGANLRLQPNSPCINAGVNTLAPAGPDLDGNPRIVGGTVDIGAYEFQSPTSLISYAWLQQYGLPTDGSADFTDPDGDGLNNWQEWRCGTDPTNALSALRLLVPVTRDTNVTVTWQSVAGVNYFLERSTNLAPTSTFTAAATNILGQPGTTTYTDTNAVGSGPFFYRVGVGN